MKVNKNSVLWTCVVLLMGLCGLSISAPLRFDRQREKRETEVKARLIKIRQAQQQYLSRKGQYCASLDELVQLRLLDKDDILIPYSDGQKFRLETNVDANDTGQQVPLMECSATFDTYLKDLNADELRALTQHTADAGGFAGLKIGDITTPNNNAGNWE